jgi:AcrR family transcriptional regulator
VEEHPWSEVSIALVSERAGLTRTAFYKHFTDRSAMLMALLEELGGSLQVLAGDWQGSDHDDPGPALRSALGALVDMYVVHGRLLRAIADEATQDEQVAALYADLARRLSAAVAERILVDVASGRSTVADPEEVATALVWMNERFLLERFGHAPFGDPDRATAALAEVWLRTVYDQ